MAQEGAEQELKFPDGFVWGSATASYQIEGAAKEGGRTPSIWDTFSETPGKVLDGDTGAVACDHYHRYREDVKLIKELGFPAYRFSISWSRLLPKGRGEVNPEAVAFYGGLLDELQANGIMPLVTLYHWDLPQSLEDEYKGWLGRPVVEDFEAYAVACFKAFGDRVKWWLTFNEPWCSAALGYANGEHAPGRKEAPGTEPYLAAHHMILAHAAAVRRYRAEFQAQQQGHIGITLNMDWKEPLTDSAADAAAHRRGMDWQLGWFADPIYKGDYPKTMREKLGARLPAFTEEEKAQVKGTSDFFGLNHYSTTFVSAFSEGEATASLSMWGKEQSGGYFDDQDCKSTTDPTWAKTDMGWSVVPWGLKHLLLWIQKEYNPPGGIYITENGCAVKEDSVEAAKEDTFRVEFLQSYMAQVHAAISEGADVRSYFAWSLMDNFEWALGYAKRFGLVHVDYATQVRTPKASARLLSATAKANALRIPEKLRALSEYTPESKARALQVVQEERGTKRKSDEL